MRPNNTKDMWEFIFENILFLIPAIISYRKLFRCIDYCTYKESKIILTVLILVSLIIGICLEYRKRRNSFSIFSNLVIPFGIYTTLAYFSTNKLLISTVLLFCVLLLVAYAMIVMMQKVKRKQCKTRIKRKRIERIIVSAQRIGVRKLPGSIQKKH